MSTEKQAALAALRGIRGDAARARGASRMSEADREALVISIGLGGRNRGEETAEEDDSHSATTFPNEPVEPADVPGKDSGFSKLPQDEEDVTPSERLPRRR